MKKTIAGKIYDTETCEIVKKTTYGTFGDPKGYEETLCKAESGNFFLYQNGGEQSIHPTETITRISKSGAEKWIAEHT